jgi:hypothetical protein
MVSSFASAVDCDKNSMIKPTPAGTRGVASFFLGSNAP